MITSVSKNKATKNYQSECKELNSLLNGWDFLGVVDEDNQNEYEDLIIPILDALEKDIGQKELSEFIVNHISQRYGATPTGTYDFSLKLLKWWKAN